MTTEPPLLIDRLRELVDLPPYEPAGDAPRWLEVLANAATHDGSALSVLGPGGIRTATFDPLRDQHGRIRAVPDPAAVLLAGLAGRVRRSEERIAIGLPPAGRHLPLLLAAAAVMGDVLDAAGGILPSRRGVLVISPDLDLRSRYSDLFVGETERLNDLKAGSRMRPTGERVLLPTSHDAPRGRRRREETRDKEGGVCFFLPQISLPAAIDVDPALIVIDARYARWVNRVDGLATWVCEIRPHTGVLAFYTVGDGDTRAALLRSGFHDLPLDHASLAEVAESMREKRTYRTGTLDWDLARAAGDLDRDHEVLQVADSSKTEDLITGIGELLDENSNEDSQDLNRCRWLLATLTQMPVPLDYYERAAHDSGRTRLERLIERVGNSRWDIPSHLAPVIQTARVALKDLYSEIKTRNVRSESLKRVLLAAFESADEKRVLLLVRDRVMQRAVVPWLMLDAFPGVEWIDRLDVRACGEYDPNVHTDYGTVVICGSFPRRYRWIGGSRLAPRVIFLAYAHEIAVITRHLNEFYGADAIRQRASRLGSTACDSPQVGARSQNFFPTLVLRAPELPARPPPTPKVLHSFEELAAAIRDVPSPPPPPRTTHGLWLEEDELPADVEDVELEDIPAAERMPAIQFEIDSRTRGKGVMWFPIDGIEEVVRAPGSDILRLSPDEIVAGDVIICLDLDGRQGLFDRMAMLASDQPEMKYLATVRRLWTEALETIVVRFRSGGTVDWRAMLIALKEADDHFRVSSEQTLRLWSRDAVIGPEDVASIRAVGRAAGSAELVRLAPDLDKAFRRMRGIRQGIGRRLSGLIRDAFHLAADQTRSDAPTLEENLQLPLEELLETIDLARVVGVGTATEVPPQWLRRWRAD